MDSRETTVNEDRDMSGDLPGKAGSPPGITGFPPSLISGPLYDRLNRAEKLLARAKAQVAHIDPAMPPSEAVLQAVCGDLAAALVEQIGPADALSKMFPDAMVWSRAVMREARR